MTVILADPKKLVHRGDPESSKEAAKRAPRPKNCETVYQLIRQCPGRTSAELAREQEWHACGPLLDKHEIRRRLYDLRQEQPPRARHGQQRKCHVANTKAVEWWPAGAPDAK